MNALKVNFHLQVHECYKQKLLCDVCKTFKLQNRCYSLMQLSSTCTVFRNDTN